MLMDKYNLISRINACYFGMQSLLDPDSFRVKQQREESASYRISSWLYPNPFDRPLMYISLTLIAP